MARGGEVLLDALSRRLAEPMGRRQALKTVGATVAGMWLAGVRPPRALADRNCSGQQICVPGNADCFTIFCPTGLICCTGPPDPRNRIQCATNPHCCDPCDPNASQCLGNGSCGPGPIAASCRCRKPGETRCGTKCCAKGYECHRGRCRKECPNGRTRCGSACCPRGQRCANDRSGTCRKCSRGQEVCGKRCCSKGTFCCDPDKGLCCKKKGGSCCNARTIASSADNWICCDEPNACAKMILPGSGGVTSASPRVCCPPGRIVPLNGTEICCPPGQRSLGGKLVVLGGSFSGGLCCPAPKTCGSGKNITCCASGAGFEQRCVNGVCVAA